MSLYEFFFPQQAQAQQLRSLAAHARVQNVGASRRNKELEGRVQSLEDDLGYIALILGSVLESLDEKGTVTRTEVKEIMKGLDEVDGLWDGKLDINVLRGRVS